MKSPTRPLDLVALRELRARAQGLSKPLPLDAQGVVSRAIALQGQSLPDVLRAIALRSNGDVAAARRAFDSGALVRGWPMRGTLFAVTPRDLAGLLSLTAERVLRAAARRRDQLGIDDSITKRAWSVASEALGEGRTRAELLAAWERSGVATDGQRGYHLIANLSMSGRMHWGPTVDTPSGGVEQRLVPTTVGLHDDDRDTTALLGRIVRGYLTARGPATLDDIAWWTKLPKRDIRRGVQANAEDIVTVQTPGSPMLVLAESLDLLEPRFGARDEIRFLPGFDEWILGYQDRSAVASPRMLDAMVPGGNGVFRPAVLVDGEVVGTWLPQNSRRREPELQIVERVSAKLRKKIERAVSDISS